jgi:hypothetical protein
MQSSSSLRWLTGAVLATWYAIAPSLAAHYDTSPKAVALLAGLGALLLAGGAAGIRRCLAAGPGRWFLGLTALQAALVAASTVASTAPALSLAGSNWRRMGALEELALLAACALASGCAAARPEDARRCLRWLVFGAVPVAAYAVLQYLGVDPLLPPAASINNGVVRPPATMGAALYLAGVLAPMTVAAAGLAWSAATRRERVALAAAGALLLVALVLTGTRSGLLATVAGACVAALAGRGRQRRIGLAAVAALIALPALLMVAPIGGSFGVRLAQWRQERAGGTRLLVWERSLRMAPEFWLLGAGPEAFPVVFPQRSSAETANNFPDHHHESPHNFLLDVAISRGWPALAGFLAMIAAATGAFRRAPGRAAPGQGTLLAMVATAAVVHLFSAFTLGDALAFYIPLGLLAGCRSAAVHDVEPAPPAWGRAERALAAFGAVAVVSAAQLAWVEWKTAAALAALDRGDVAAALVEFESGRSAQPPGASLEFRFARSLYEKLDSVRDVVVRAQAESALLRLTEAASARGEEPANALLLEGHVFARQVQDQGAERAWRRAIAAAPYWYAPRLALSRLLLRRGKVEEARQEGLRALDLAGPDHADVRAYYNQLLALQQESSGFTELPPGAQQ